MADVKKRKPKKITERYLHNAGLYYLQRYSASRKHFKKIMMRKVKKSCLHHSDQNYDECEKLVDKLVEKFIEIGLLNDEDYVRAHVTTHRRRGLSQKAIFQKMIAKGAKADDINTALEKIDSETENPELKAAIRFLERKRKGPFALKEQDEDDDRKTLASMARAGFSYDIAKKAMNVGDNDDYL